MFSTPLISCSSGAATVSAITFGFAPGYCARTMHRRRHDLGILADRQLPHGDGADQEDDDRQHRREDRAVDEEAREFHGS